MSDVKDSESISTKDENPILSGPLRSIIMKLAMPMMIAMLLQVAFNLVDTFFISLLGGEELAAMGLSFPLFMIIIALSTGMGIGISSLVARRIGENNLDEAGNVAVHALLLSLALGVIISLAGFLLHRQVLIYTGVTGIIFEMSSSYIRVIFVMAIFNFMLFGQEGIFRGSGQIKFSMIAMLAATLANLILDPLLIFGLFFFPRLELAGAAWATGISWLIGSLIAGSFFMKKKVKAKPNLNCFSFKLATWGDIIQVGIPSALSQATMAFSMTFINNFALNFGPAVVAAYAVGFRIDQITLVPGMAISAAIIVAVGQNYGARHWLRVQEGFQQGVLLTIIVMGTLALLVFCFPGTFMGMFTRDSMISGSEIWRAGFVYLRYSSVGYIFLGAGMVANSSFQACGLGLPALINTLFRLLALTIPMAYLFAFPMMMGAPGLWLGMLLANICFGLLGLSWFYHGYSRKLILRSA